MATTSDGLKALLERKGVSPTGDRAKDLELAKNVMPNGYSRLPDPKP